MIKYSLNIDVIRTPINKEKSPNKKYDINTKIYVKILIFIYSR
jgi:hypothetical protein